MSAHVHFHIPESHKHFRGLALDFEGGAATLGLCQVENALIPTPYSGPWGLYPRIGVVGQRGEPREQPKDLGLEGSWVWVLQGFSDQLELCGASAALGVRCFLAHPYPDPYSFYQQG